MRSKTCRCPECQVGTMYIEECIPDWGTEADARYSFKCNHCDYKEDADWYDPEDDEEPEED